MTTPIQPALTREQWDAVQAEESSQVLTWVKTHTGRERHILGALALFGQPFGFTRQDVGLLNKLPRDYDGLDLSYAMDWHGDAGSHLDSLAARIAALLPPEDMLR